MIETLRLKNVVIFVQTILSFVLSRKIMDINIQCDNDIETRRSDLILVDKKANSCVIIDVAIPVDCRICEKEVEKIEKYQNLKRELKRLWSLKKVEVVPVVVELWGALARASVDGWTHSVLN